MIKILFSLTIILYIFPHSVLAGYQDLERKINAQRKYPLVSNADLDAIAYCRASYQVTRGIFSHDNHQYCFRKFGAYSNYGEILAQGYVNDDRIVRAWLNSPGHNRVMKANWKYIGSSKVKDITVVVFR